MGSEACTVRNLFGVVPTGDDVIEISLVDIDDEEEDSLCTVTKAKKSEVRRMEKKWRTSINAQAN
jgi:hypothetical protein